MLFAFLISCTLHIRLDIDCVQKRQVTANCRPLDRDSLRYAAVDAIYLPFLAYMLRKELLEQSESGDSLAIYNA